MVRLIVVLSALGALVGSACAAPVPNAPAPEPLPEEVVKAWEKAGAEVGWADPG